MPIAAAVSTSPARLNHSRVPTILHFDFFIVLSERHRDVKFCVRMQLNVLRKPVQGEERIRFRSGRPEMLFPSHLRRREMVRCHRPNSRPESQP